MSKDVASDDMFVTPKTIKVATLNVRRFFDRKCDSGRCEQGDYESVLSENDYNAKVSKIQDAIRVLDADVIVFQEIEKQSTLEEIIEPYKTTYPTLVFGEIGTQASVDVGMISKGNLLETKKHRQNRLTKANGQSTSFAREFLEVHTEINGVRVIAFGAHFVSKVSDDGSRRLAEGKAAANLMAFRANEYSNALVVLGGDLNDSPNSPTLQAFFDAKISSTSFGFSLSEFYTHSFNGQAQAIDYVLYWNRPNISVEAVKAFHDENRTGYAGSDHAAVRAIFTVR